MTQRTKVLHLELTVDIDYLTAERMAELRPQVEAQLSFHTGLMWGRLDALRLAKIIRAKAYWNDDPDDLFIDIK